MSEQEKNDAAASSEKAEKSRNWLGWLVLVAALAMGVQAIYAQHEQSEQSRSRAQAVRCLSTWGKQLGRAIDARTSASTATTQARAQYDAAVGKTFTTLSQTLSKPITSDADFGPLREALAGYKTAFDKLSRATSNQKQATLQQPYPDPPENCIK